MGKKITIIILSVILVGALGFGIYWLSNNWNKVQNNLDSKNLYTSEDLENAKLDGYNEALKDKATLEDTIQEYRTTISELTDIVSKKQSEIKEKTDLINDLTLQLRNTEMVRDEYYSLLQSSELRYETLLSKYNLEVEKVQKLQSEITKLNAEKNELQLNLTNARNKIIEMQETIRGYENFIQGLITENQVVAKFYYDNSLYSILVLQKGDKANISDPADTTYKEFIGWYVDDELVDLSTYTINENTTFVAGINQFYDVKFKVDDTEYDSDIVIDGGYSEVPTAPSKTGYEFDGWMINNVVYDVDTYPITESTTFVAKFTKIHTVQFIHNEEVISTQKIRNNEYATFVNPEHNDYLQFNYWMVNNIQVEIEYYPITSDVVFVSNTTEKFDVKFMYEDTEYSKQIVLNGNCATSVTPNSTDYKKFKGWSTDGKSIIDITRTPINSTTTYYAVIDYYYLVTFNVDNSTYGDPQFVLKNDIANIPGNPSKNGYEFDGWTTDKNTIVNPNTMKITNNVVFYAKFTKLYSVKFEHKGTIINTQTIRNNEYATTENITSTDKEIFNGWMVNNAIVDVSTYKITSDVTFVASITYKNLVQFKLYDEVIKSEYVVDDTFTTEPSMSSYTDYTFNYWTIDGSTKVDVASYKISDDTTFIAKVTRNKYTGTFTNTNAVSSNNVSNGKNYVYTLKNASDFNKSNFNGFTYTGKITINGTTYDISGTTGDIKNVGGIQVYISGSYYDSLAITIYSTSVSSFSCTLTLTARYGMSGL